MSHRRLGDLTREIVDEHRRKDDLRRGCDGRIPPRMMASPGTLEERIANLERLIGEGERKAAEREASVTEWIERGQLRTAISCRNDAQSIRDTIDLYRATLAEIRPVTADEEGEAA